jgi:minor curlin subunit
MVMGKESLISLTCLYLLSCGFNNAIASDMEGDFLHNVSQDIVNDYNYLESLPSGDLDNYSEINISNASESMVIIKQRSPGITANNRAKITQSGSSNSALIVQAGRNNIALIDQDGLNNDASIRQRGRNSGALISQDGMNNIAEISQANFSRHSNQLSINQTGNGNTAYLAGHGASNIGISQDGNDFASVSASSSMRIYINQAN